MEQWPSDSTINGLPNRYYNTSNKVKIMIKKWNVGWIHHFTLFPFHTQLQPRHFYCDVELTFELSSSSLIGWCKNACWRSRLFLLDHKTFLVQLACNILNLDSKMYKLSIMIDLLAYNMYEVVNILLKWRQQYTFKFQ